MNTLITAIAWTLLISMGAIIVYYTFADGSLKWIVHEARRYRNGRVRK